MPYFSARGFAGSVLFHTPRGRRVTLEENTAPPVTVRHKEGEEAAAGSRGSAADLFTAMVK